MFIGDNRLTDACDALLVSCKYADALAPQRVPYAHDIVVVATKEQPATARERNRRHSHGRGLGAWRVDRIARHLLVGPQVKEAHRAVITGSG